jgi:hypothetical protein
MTPIAQRIAMLNSAPRIRQTMPVRIKVLPPVLAWVGEMIATLAGVNQNPLGVLRDTVAVAVCLQPSADRCRDCS